MIIKYTALRSILSAHVSGTLYTMAPPSVQKLDIMNVSNRNDVKALGGTVETTFINEDQVWDITIGDYARTSGVGTLEEVREFYDSVQEGEVFTFDAYGTIALADNEQSVILDTRMGWRPRRIGTTNFFNISLQFIVQ